MRIAFILKKRPRSGHFFCGWIVSICFALVFAGWMMSLHFPPWLSWHSEMLVFASVLLLSGALIKSHYVHGSRPILLPTIGWPMGLLCMVVAIQVTIGRIVFKGDAVVLIFYLLLCDCKEVYQLGSQEIKDFIKECSKELRHNETWKTGQPGTGRTATSPCTGQWAATSATRSATKAASACTS